MATAASERRDGDITCRPRSVGRTILQKMALFEGLSSFESTFYRTADKRRLSVCLVLSDDNVSDRNSVERDSNESSIFYFQ
jgi:hypothetical protein